MELKGEATICSNGSSTRVSLRGQSEGVKSEWIYLLITLLRERSCVVEGRQQHVSWPMFLDDGDPR